MNGGIPLSLPHKFSCFFSWCYTMGKCSGRLMASSVDTNKGGLDDEAESVVRSWQ